MQALALRLHSARCPGLFPAWRRASHQATGRRRALGSRFPLSGNLNARVRLRRGAAVGPPGPSRVGGGGQFCPKLSAPPPTRAPTIGAGEGGTPTLLPPPRPRATPFPLQTAQQQRPGRAARVGPSARLCSRREQRRPTSMQGLNRSLATPAF